ncbi:aceric acid hydrolase [Allorhodopirellula heiligendammensis]|uniref:Non-reducing end beta-L-arabinofuranosidase n=1 Tax=Allorhodopirellula heiligendammensis TaxID=2714739 RepID=A0A5C6C3P7_9BACT|nr:glycoside hydrolase family 127 protein [Allorhodopirellula heiligendammensis]TWU18712.1 Non-reducing end beta-L-arabinofuranosidase [Allorhodopirellula heiligendammensis]
MRQFHHILFIVLSLFAVQAAAQPIHVSPCRKVEPLRLADVQWTDGFWKQHFDTCRDKTVPALWDIMRGTKYKPYLEHFRIAAGLSEGGYHGAPFNDGDFYKWIEAVCAIQATGPVPPWDSRLEEIIEIIGKAQRADGYIHTPVLIANLNGDETVKPFGDRFNFEMYNMGHLMTAACVHHDVTGKDSLMIIARKAADFLDETYRNPTAEQAGHAICPSHYMGLLDLYRATGEPRYLNLARRLIQMRDEIVSGGDDNQDRLPFARQTEAVGHAVRATYLYAGIADMYCETGDEKLWEPLTAIWNNLVEKKLYITGGCGALYDGASPDGSKNQAAITRVHQAFGRNYQLPNTTAHNETCANIGNALWNWRMFLASGEAKYIDVIERALYNSVLSGVSLDGTDFFYTNPLRVSESAPVDLRWPPERVPFVTSFCCPPNIARTIAQVSGFAYGKSDDTIWVNLYGSNALDTYLADGRHIAITQRTAYPFDGNVQITVTECDRQPMKIKLRIPGWATSATLSVDGEPTAQELIPGTYVSLERVWQRGTEIALCLAMPPRLIESHPLVEETRNHLAVQRGPIVYCLESIDLPTGTSLEEVRIPSDITLRSRHDTSLLGGVSVLEGTAISKPTGAWQNQLYREFDASNATPVPIRLIPYYAWSNRAKSEMSVWLPQE